MRRHLKKYVRTAVGTANYKSVVMKRIRKSSASRESRQFSESYIWAKKGLCKTKLMRYSFKSLISSRHHNTREVF